MGGIRRLVLDVLKPHEPILTELAKEISKMPGVEGVNISLIELDKDTENIKITIEGRDLNYEEIKSKIEQCGGRIHSIDVVAAGRRLVEEVETIQDKR
ncbi:hypothetical protein DRN46_03410 [Thermococci archaeon]|nr:MAG: hypothetical protein DRN46_03410 [Thermococci archaeon]RLF97436.1 MAG: hypothetical protein DRN52_00095 [Thermococci archaeon]